MIEAGERSGTSITADCAREQGREVFAVPGRITDPMSVGTNRMLSRGEAKAVTSAGDILSDFVSQFPAGTSAYLSAQAYLVRFGHHHRFNRIYILPNEDGPKTYTLQRKT